MSASVNIVPDFDVSDRHTDVVRRDRALPIVTVNAGVVVIAPFQFSDDSMPFIVRGRGVVRLVVGVHRLLGGQTVTKVGLSRTVLGTLTCTQERRNGDRDQDGNDQHDHHQLNEGEALLLVPTTGSK